MHTSVTGARRVAFAVRPKAPTFPQVGGLAAEHVSPVPVVIYATGGT